MSVMSDPSAPDPSKAGTAPTRLTPHPRIVIDLQRDGTEDESFRHELAESLTETPRRLPSKYFYDTHGSELFEEITRLPEYYPTRAERAILETHADEIIERSGADELVELGSGAAVKTRVLLDAMERADRLHLYVPVDVSEAMVERVARRFVERYPSLQVHGLVADFLAHLGHIPEGDRRLAVLLGGTIGNLHPDEARSFLALMAQELDPGDAFLLGTDLIKDPAVIEAAYNDSAGVTAAFNLNILTVVNRLADADFDPEAFRHEATWNPDDHRIEMWLVAERPQTVHLANPALELALDEGERLLTEISTKYDRDKAERLLDGAGFTLERWLTDPDDLFALSLARRR